jgi:hypothetical protein
LDEQFLDALRLEADDHSDAFLASQGLSNGNPVRKYLRLLMKVHDWARKHGTEPVEALEDIELAGEDARKIAKLCAVSHTQVMRIKKSLQIDQVTVSEPDEENSSEENNYPDDIEENDKLEELATENVVLSEENQRLKDQLAIQQMDTDPLAKAEIEETIDSLRAQVSKLESQLKAMTISRNDYQRQASDAIEQVKYWKRRAEKSEKK